MIVSTRAMDLRRSWLESGLAWLSETVDVCKGRKRERVIRDGGLLGDKEDTNRKGGITFWWVWMHFRLRFFARAVGPIRFWGRRVAFWGHLYSSPIIARFWLLLLTVLFIRNIRKLKAYKKNSVPSFSYSKPVRPKRLTISISRVRSEFGVRVGRLSVETDAEEALSLFWFRKLIIVWSSDFELFTRVFLVLVSLLFQSDRRRWSFGFHFTIVGPLAIFLLIHNFS